MRYKQHVDVMRYDDLKQILQVNGWLMFQDGRKYELEARVDGKKVPCKVQWGERKDVLKLWKGDGTPRQSGYRLAVHMGEDAQSLELWVKAEGIHQMIAKKGRRELLRVINAPSIRYCLDIKCIRGKKLLLQGWTVSCHNEDVKIQMEDETGRKVPIKLVRRSRLDVLEMFQGEIDTLKCGFNLEVAEEAEPFYYLVLSDSSSVLKILLDREKIKRQQKLLNSYPARFIKEARARGMKTALNKAYRKLTGQEAITYEKWFALHKASKSQLEEQRKAKFEYEPKFSIAVPLYRTPEKYLREMIQSVTDQTYGNWELCLADGGGRENSVGAVVREYSERDSRIRYVQLEENLGIAGNTNAALDMARGDFLALLDHDDLLAPDALYECVKAVNSNPGTDIVYTDEDKIDMEGKHHFDPHFKPDFNPDLLRSNNYICHFFTVKREIAEKIGGFKSAYDGAQDYDFIIRCTEQSEKIVHVPRILYYWRAHPASTALNQDSKQYAFDAGIRVLEDYYARKGIPVEVSHGASPGIYRTVYGLEQEPLVSVLIPSKDNREDLDQCLRSILERSDYKNVEVIVIENNSVEPETFAYYEKIKKKYAGLKVVTWKGDGKFNYSALNNFGASEARGEYLLLLNNDTEFIDAESLREMVRIAQRPEVGIVGARLWYPDRTLQHGGVAVGIGGVANHIHQGLPEGEPGYMNRPACTQDLSAVTAACMMVRKTLYEELGGLTEELAVAFNDIDFCLRVREAGYLIVYDPYVQLYHYESKSRGRDDDSPEKIERFADETEYFQRRWARFLAEGDPNYNPNFSLETADYSLREHNQD